MHFDLKESAWFNSIDLINNLLIRMVTWQSANLKTPDNAIYNFDKKLISVRFARKRNVGRH